MLSGCSPAPSERSGAASRSVCGATSDTRFLQQILIEPVRVLERVEHGESRLDSGEDRGVSAAVMQVDEQRSIRLAHGAERDGHVDRNRRRPDAALGADEAEDLALLRPGRGSRVTRATASATLSSVNGSATTSLTPARIASTSSVGSSVAAAITMPTSGCWRRKVAQAAGTAVAPASVEHDDVGQLGRRRRQTRQVGDVTVTCAAIERRISSSWRSRDPTSRTLVSISSLHRTS